MGQSYASVTPASHTRASFVTTLAAGRRLGVPYKQEQGAVAGVPALDGLLDPAALQAARADVGPRRLPAEENANALQVRVEAPLRGHHRMASVVAERGLLPA